MVPPANKNPDVFCNEIWCHFLFDFYDSQTEISNLFLNCILKWKFYYSGGRAFAISSRMFVWIICLKNCRRYKMFEVNI